MLHQDWTRSRHAWATASSHPSTRPPPAPFFVSPLRLALCGLPRKVGRDGRRCLRLTSHRATRERWAYRPGPGGVATVLLDGCPYRLVYVRYPVLELNWTAVSSSIDSCRFFSGFPGENTAWCAVKIHNHCRHMGAPESCCERIGSLMQAAWSKLRHQQPGDLMDEVLLWEAGVTCMGSQ